MTKNRKRSKAARPLVKEPIDRLEDEPIPVCRIECTPLRIAADSEDDADWLQCMSADTAGPATPFTVPKDGCWDMNCLKRLVPILVASARDPDKLRILLPMASVVKILAASTTLMQNRPNVVRFGPSSSSSSAGALPKPAPPSSTENGGGGSRPGPKKSGKKSSRKGTANSSSDNVCSLAEPHASPAASGTRPMVWEDSSGRAVYRVVGDLHGQLFDLLNVLRCLGRPSPSNIVIFDGDFVDRGSFGLEVVLLLLCCQLAFPVSVILLRGNHESQQINFACGFVNELRRKYPRTTADSRLGVMVDSADSSKSNEASRRAALTALSPEVTTDKEAPPLHINFQWVWRRLPLGVHIVGIAFVVHGGLWRSDSSAAVATDLPPQLQHKPRKGSAARKRPSIRSLSFPWNGGQGRRNSSAGDLPATATGTGSLVTVDAALSGTSKKQRHLHLGTIEQLHSVQRSVPEPFPDTPLADLLWSDPSPCHCSHCACLNGLACGDRSVADMFTDQQLFDLDRPDTSLRRNRLRGEGIRWNCGATQEFARANNVRLVIRGHEGPSPEISDDAMEKGVSGPKQTLTWRLCKGYQVDHCGQLPAGRDTAGAGAVLSIFSAPNYPQFKSAANREKLAGMGMPRKTRGAVVSLDCRSKDHLYDKHGSMRVQVYDYDLETTTPARSICFYTFESTDATAELL